MTDKRHVLVAISDRRTNDLVVGSLASSAGVEVYSVRDYDSALNRIITLPESSVVIATPSIWRDSVYHQKVCASDILSRALKQSQGVRLISEASLEGLEGGLDTILSKFTPGLKTLLGQPGVQLVDKEVFTSLNTTQSQIYDFIEGIPTRFLIYEAAYNTKI
jgi:hypothetical protein